MKVIFSLIPVFLFLLMLLAFDSYRLVKLSTMAICLLWGVAAAFLSLLGNTLATDTLHLDFDLLSRYVAPLTEEVLKMVILLVLISRHRIGFAIDAAIYGFSVGTGFAFTENLIYLLQLSSGQADIWIWVARGFGTAVMHGGATAIAGIILINRLTKSRRLYKPVLLAIVVTWFIHTLYNAFFLSPMASALVMILLIPAILMAVFRLSTRNLTRWLDMGMDSEVSLLLMINQGKFSDTRAGKYLMSIKDHYPKEVVFDMYCYTSLFLELSIKAKSILMLKENDLQVPIDNGTHEKLEELANLRKSIGRSGLLALHPILRMTRKDLWAISGLK